MTTASERTKQQMLANAREITCLKVRIHETSVVRDESEKNRQAWKSACAEFHSRYNELAFPGGYHDAVERILEGQPTALEAALCFLECRPYFFRSGYMYSEILRKAKRARLNEAQAERLKLVLQRQREWRARRLLANAA